MIEAREVVDEVLSEGTLSIISLDEKTLEMMEEVIAQLLQESYQRGYSDGWNDAILGVE